MRWRDALALHLRVCLLVERGPLATVVAQIQPLQIVQCVPCQAVDAVHRPLVVVAGLLPPEFDPLVKGDVEGDLPHFGMAPQVAPFHPCDVVFAHDAFAAIRAKCLALFVLRPHGVFAEFRLANTLGFDSSLRQTPFQFASEVDENVFAHGL
jgi:hypothetical protein